MLPRTDVPRGGPREAVIIRGRWQVGERPPEDVLITDLGSDGCRLRASSIGLTKLEPVQLWLDEFGPVAARLRWVKKGALGLAFEEPLNDAVLRQLVEAPAAPVPSNVVPLARHSTRRS